MTKCRIKNWAVRELLANAVPYIPENLPNDPILIRELKRLMKKTDGRVQVVPTLIITGFPLKVKTRRFYEDWSL